ncbi:elongation factor P maturation arginine rhamnosyltransferase EarP [Massilia forsythiae]|uniref:Protein-arginine rhamnosyltransferase n=1 Tax=Massilia forsythiae TaxID=2728020 RepID=A0A7Z2VYI2_9BURK|nr:elongation factor P maturation arginine rhamnosyltransferase EarP [Massilia forsythiae]QJE01469.1 elongation factor P maturation arginine rhamnosyltransferase EarP [Massilia forsythiae]
MQSTQGFPRSLAIFCKVVDNFGDIGICWRLARLLRHEHAIAVTLWVDDLRSFRRIWPAVDAGAEVQEVDGVQVRHWRGQDGGFDPAGVPDIVIEFFGVELPPGYVAAMARRDPPPVWINYEGLSAEAWVEGCHTLPSMHPRLKLTKHFFFPGFTAKTGGLLREAALLDQRDRFRADPAALDAFFAQLGLSAQEIAAAKAGLRVSLFCYPEAPIDGLFGAWEAGARPVTCLVPEGVAAERVAAFFGAPAVPGATATRGALTLRVIPFMAQTDYDRLLWACDLNFVRGEDSWVRAQWAGRPFVWHIYPQDENLHHVKLRAFLQMAAGSVESLIDFSLRWNGAAGTTTDERPDWPALWTALQADLPAIDARAAAWQASMLANGDLVSNLLRFARSLR